MKFLYLQRPEPGRKRGRLWLTFANNFGAKHLSQQGKRNISFKLRRKIQENPDFSNPRIFEIQENSNKTQLSFTCQTLSFYPWFFNLPDNSNQYAFPKALRKIGIPPQSKVHKVAKEMSKYFSVLIVFLFLSKSKRIMLFYFKIPVEMSISLTK